HSKISRTRFQRFENAPTDAETARIGSDPHALDFADSSILHFERAATDGLTAEAGDDEDAGGGGQVLGGGGGGLLPGGTRAGAGLLFAGSKPVLKRPASSRKYCPRYQRASALSGASAVM